MARRIAGRLMVEDEYCICGALLVTLPDGSKECPRCDKPRRVRK